METETEFVTATEMARELSVNVSTVGRWIKAKKVAGVRLPDGSYVIPRTEIDRARSRHDAFKTIATYKATSQV